MKKRVLAGLSAAAAVTLVLAPTASAATEFGSSCTANRAEPGESPFALIQLAQNGVATAAPASGVITQWKIRLIPAPVTLSHQLKVFRPTADPAQFQVVGESAFANVGSGENVFPTRIPIQAGDRLGLFGNSFYGTLWCESPESAVPGNSVGISLGNPTTGSTATLAKTVNDEWLVPAAAVIEPDADNDGYGDETQDLCPQSAAVQVACPAVTIDAVLIPGKKWVTVLVATSSTAPVRVTGTVNLGKGAKAKLSAKPKPVSAGKLVRFTLRFPGSLKDRLKELEPKRKLTLKLTARATNVAGLVSTDRARTKLKGQG